MIDFVQSIIIKQSNCYTYIMHICVCIICLFNIKYITITIKTTAIRINYNKVNGIKGI